MKMNKLPEPLVIPDFLAENELKAVWKEVDFLSNTLFTPEQTFSARDAVTNEFLKKNLGVSLVQVMDLNYSTIARTFNRVMSDAFVAEALTVDPFYKYLKLINHSRYVLHYYTDGDFYKEHMDTFVISGVFFLHREPKKFTGGELVFPETDIEVTPNNNTFVLFPSASKHYVKPVAMDNSDEGFGRYSIAQFLTINI